jgi:hypothetical protein
MTEHDDLFAALQSLGATSAQSIQEILRDGLLTGMLDVIEQYPADYTSMEIQQAAAQYTQQLTGDAQIVQGVGGIFGDSYVIGWQAQQRLFTQLASQPDVVIRGILAGMSEAITSYPTEQDPATLATLVETAMEPMPAELAPRDLPVTAEQEAAYKEWYTQVFIRGYQLQYAMVQQLLGQVPTANDAP